MDDIRIKNIDISIHAPTGGATCHILRAFIKRTISIHAPTGGATMSAKADLIAYGISIHAPTGGATRQKDCKKGCAKFQSTLPQGERLQKCTKTIRFLHSAFIKFTQSNEQLQYIF